MDVLSYLESRGFSTRVAISDEDIKLLEWINFNMKNGIKISSKYYMEYRKLGTPNYLF